MSKRLKFVFKALGWLSVCLAIGFFVTRGVTTIFDTFDHYDRSRWIIDKYRHLFLGTPDVDLINQLKWYAPLWELILGVFSEIILKNWIDPIWVRMAVTASFFPFTLIATFVLLRKSAVPAPTAALACAMLLSAIRLGGHSLFNSVDFPLACFYLLSALASFWVISRRSLDLRSLIALGAITVCPYLIRSPQIAPLIAILLMGSVYAIFCEPKLGAWSKIRHVLVPLLTALAIIYCVWPSVWEKPSYKGWHAWLQSFGGFMWFWWRGEILAFGQLIKSDQVPFWYPVAWFPLLMNPLAFFLVVCAPVVAYRGRKTLSQVREIEFRVVRSQLANKIPIVKISLALWLTLFTLMGLLGLWILKPILYDEERHILFLYPPLIIAAGVALRSMKAHTQWVLAVTLTFTSIATYAEWGIQSYTYKSPIVLNRGADQFMGDYWGACLTEAASRLAKNVRPGTRFIVPGPPGPRRNVHHAADRANSEQGYVFLEKLDPPTAPAVQIVFNRNNGIAAELAMVEAQGAKPVFELRDPLGHLTCVALSWDAITKSR